MAQQHHAPPLEKLPEPELRWVRPPELEHYQPYVQPETFRQKIVRKVKANPFVPFGVLLTTAALTVGLVSMKRGDQKMSQYMMRARVGAQAITVAALVVGVIAIGAKAK